MLNEFSVYPLANLLILSSGTALCVLGIMIILKKQRSSSVDARKEEASSEAELKEQQKSIYMSLADQSTSLLGRPHTYEPDASRRQVFDFSNASIS